MGARRARLLLASLALALTWLMAGEALACPRCPTSRAVRAWLFEGASWRYLGLLLLPLVVLSGLTVLLHRVDVIAPGSREPRADEGAS